MNGFDFDYYFNANLSSCTTNASDAWVFISVPNKILKVFLEIHFDFQETEAVKKKNRNWVDDSLQNHTWLLEKATDLEAMQSAAQLEVIRQVKPSGVKLSRDIWFVRAD